MPEPTRHDLDDDLIDRATRRILPERLAARRWFADKGKTIASVEPQSRATISDADEPSRLLRIRVGFADGTSSSYQLPVVLSRSESDRFALVDTGVEEGDRRIHLREPRDDEAFWTELLDAVVDGRPLPASDGEILLRPLPGVETALRPPFVARSLSADQSNSSVVINETSLLKLYRRVEPGPHPEVELCLHLTAVAGFAGCPRALGWLEHRDRHGRTRMLGLLQEYVTGSDGAWDSLVDSLRDRPEDQSSSLASRLPRQLGRLTAKLHAALAEFPVGEDLAPRHEGVVASWRDEALRGLDRCRDAATGAAGLPRSIFDDAHDRLLALAPRDAAEAGHGMRIHGDFHLGQIIRRGDDLWVVDFEGEPARPLAERRLPSSPLRDVAGMLRSFSYAAAEAAPCAGDADLEAWEASAREAYLGSYYESSAPGLGPFLPDPTRREQVLTFFELEKAIYELLYEIRNRPEKVGVPSRGILRLLGRG